MRNTKIFQWTFLTLVLFIAFTTHAAKFTMVVEATYAPERGKEVYESFRQWLSNKTGHDIEIIIDNNYYSYWRQANGNRMPDFTFDSPDIAAFRAIEKSYKPLAATEEDLVFHLISLDDKPEGVTVQSHMTNKKVALLPNPSLASIYFKQWFTDLFASPQKNVAALDWQETIDIVFDGAADAAIVPQWMFDLYPNYLSLMQSDPIPGRTFMASPNVSQEIIDNFKNVLLTMHEDEEAGYDLSYELNTVRFKEVDLSKYQDLMSLLPTQFRKKSVNR